MVAAIAIAMDAYTLDAYVLDTLMRDLVGHDRRPSAYLVYLAVLTQEDSLGCRLSHAELSARTGLSKRAVQDALAHLKRRELISTKSIGPTQITWHKARRPWRRA